MSVLHLPHHDGSTRYVSTLEPKLGETVTLFVRVPVDAGIRQVYVRATPDGEPSFTAAVVDHAVLDANQRGEVWWRAEVQVRNPVTNYRFLLDGKQGDWEQRWLTAAGVVDHDVPDATDFRLVAYDPPPAWAADAVVYEIFPDRFARSAAAGGRQLPDWAISCDWERTPVLGSGPQTPFQFYGGDLDGIVERLDHIAGLGANAVYLTPVFPARSNHRYDAASFDTVDPLLGGDAALARLARAVHARGWRLLGDITTNHTGDAHPWFTAPEPDFYYFSDDGQYESWLGVRSLPKLNWGSQALRERFTRGMTAWLDKLDGWRVDVANMTGRRGADAYTHEVAALLRRAVVGARPDVLLVAEHAHDAGGDLDRDGWHGTMNYAGFTRPLWNWLRADRLDLPDFLGVPGGVPRRDGPAAVATMRAFAAARSWRSLTASWNLLGSHDTPRIRTVVGDAARGEVAAGLLLTMPGTPMIFAGDEWGLRGGNGEASRTPMPWHRAHDATTFGYYQALVRLRHDYPALRHGGLRWAHVDAETMVFLRETADQAILVLARRAPGVPVRLAGLPGLAGRAEIAGPAGAAGLGVAANIYGGAPDLLPDADGVVTLPADGPAFQAWLITS